MKALLSTIIAFLIFLNLNAQVGINNNSPEQTLDVNGKLKITDDANTPTAGTIRYTTFSDDFEGYNGTEWKSLTEQKSSGTPSNPVPYFGRSNPVTVGNGIGDPGLVTLQSWENNASFNSVPAGKFFLVTRIQAQDNNLTTTFERIDCLLYAAQGTSLRSSTQVRMVGSNRELVTLTGDQSNPLMILRPGDRITIFNNNLASETTINVLIHGFLVNELDF
ncbi:hypothetical protein EV196_102637 [Mariniflexile fucanivorans]|uniref:Uncharacterized protein n=1 Tax=Mariniflexile fucanivorans TaxID=264023 RepID=A0A4R1RQA5_9FLAO|nr:hypothetical protein [Mariniflexile fucanivorans]TCL68072.1 hypothetical protein EV196_102637 [Mariniflexile fucanivorans]